MDILKAYKLKKGKYKDIPIIEVPRWYLKWALEKWDECEDTTMCATVLSLDNKRNKPLNNITEECMCTMNDMDGIVLFHGKISELQTEIFGNDKSLRMEKPGLITKCAFPDRDPYGTNEKYATLSITPIMTKK